MHMDYQNIYVASFNRDEIFNLKTFKFEEREHEFEVGDTMRDDNGVLVDCRPEHRLSPAERERFNQDEKLMAQLANIFSDKLMHLDEFDVPVLVNDYNRFLSGFCDYVVTTDDVAI